ncbi:MAG: bifunctional serine/threonine-protein kinase/formylglycine-generating enzyme family protein, partial [Candidatus Cloacimonadaceae bacterium]|nr:bifunctional serine/threonine-protein kinase/formylglycine-generating enzyme family protein [Candidatus Cloacimonadaceae bacterium]
VYYMVMEYAEGNMLKELIAMTGPIPEPRALHIFKQIVNALAYAHSKAIIHRDIKPSNIMIDASDNVKIMDFGIARLMTDKHLTRTGSKLGTLFYMSPEQVKARKDIDHRTDIYSAGVVLYEMLTGKLPYTADTDSDFDVMLEIVNNELPDPRTIYPHIGDSMVQLVSNMTAKDKQHRPDTGKIKTKLEQFEGKHIFYPEEANKPFIKEKSIPAAPESIFQAPAAVEQPLDDVSHKVPWDTESPESYTPKTSSTKLRNMLLIIGSIVIFILIFLWIRTSNNAPSIDPVSVPETEIGDTSMIFVQGDSFKMGSNDGESVEKPVHQVTVSSFYIGKYEVTQKEWTAVMGSNPSYWKGDNLPVERVSWYDAIDYCNKRSLKEGLKPCYSIGGNTKPSSWSSGTIACDWTANGYRLPTEAEWEYAARGGNKSKGYDYSGSNDINTVAWHYDNSGNKTRDVGTKSANELGIHDMSGNVWEWCWDWYDEEYYGKSPSSDPRGASSGDYRVLRGGSWNDCGRRLSGCPPQRLQSR